MATARLIPIMVQLDLALDEAKGLRWLLEPGGLVEQAPLASPYLSRLGITTEIRRSIYTALKEAHV